jgi:hypothetical protein
MDTADASVNIIGCAPTGFAKVVAVDVKVLIEHLVGQTLFVAEHLVDASRDRPAADEFVDQH